jgi:hypothetical protein
MKVKIIKEDLGGLVRFFAMYDKDIGSGSTEEEAIEDLKKDVSIRQQTIHEEYEVDVDLD